MNADSSSSITSIFILFYRLNTDIFHDVPLTYGLVPRIEYLIGSFGKRFSKSVICILPRGSHPIWTWYAHFCPKDGIRCQTANKYVETRSHNK
jgi:hypothetical protein